jgi:hypothetical protein
MPMNAPEMYASSQVHLPNSIQLNHQQMIASRDCQVMEVIIMRMTVVHKIYHHDQRQCRGELQHCWVDLLMRS